MNDPHVNLWPLHITKRTKKSGLTHHQNGRTLLPRGHNLDRAPLLAARVAMAEGRLTLRQAAERLGLEPAELRRLLYAQPGLKRSERQRRKAGS